MASKSQIPDAMVALHKSPFCSSEIGDCIQVMVYQRHGITLLPMPATRVIVIGVSCKKVITDVQTSEEKLCDLRKQNDSLPSPLISLKTNLQR